MRAYLLMRYCFASQDIVEQSGRGQDASGDGAQQDHPQTAGVKRGRGEAEGTPAFTGSVAAGFGADKTHAW